MNYPVCDYCREMCFTRDGIYVDYDPTHIFCTLECAVAYKLYIERKKEDATLLSQKCGRRVFAAPERKYLCKFQRHGNPGMARSDWLTQCRANLTEEELQKTNKESMDPKDVRIKK